MKKTIIYLGLLLIMTSCFDKQFEEFMGWDDNDITLEHKAENDESVEQQIIINGKYSIASEQVLSLVDLKSNYFKDDDLKIMRNEIFARHGYKFIDGGAMDTYFKQQDWYQPRYDNVDHLLTDIEKANISMIQSLESEIADKKSNFKPDNTEEAENNAGGYGTILVENLRLRDSPNLEGETITLLAKDAFVNVEEVSSFKTIIELNGEQINDVWYKIITNDDSIGWVHGCCIEVTFP